MQQYKKSLSRFGARLRFGFIQPVEFLVRSLVALLLVMCATAVDAAAATAADSQSLCNKANTVKADVVAIEQAYVLNRFSAFVPAGMLYALRGDLVPLDDAKPIGPGNARLRETKRPRPLVLRVNKEDCLEVSFTNWLSPEVSEEGGIPLENGGRMPSHVEEAIGSKSKNQVRKIEKVSVDRPRTRASSLHITGLNLVPILRDQCPPLAACGGDGSNVGFASKGTVFKDEADRAKFAHGSLAMPGQTVVTRWFAAKEGAYFAYSMGAPVGGEGDGGQIGLGLFASVNVEPAGSTWYRSQVTYHEMHDHAAKPVANGHHPYSNIDYEAKDERNKPILRILDSQNNIIHSDLNAIIVPKGSRNCNFDGSDQAYGTVLCNNPFREFTVIFHDEVHAQQAFAELEDETNPLHLIKDGMGINYGVSSMGSLVMSTPKQGKNTGVAKNCPECRGEEFFLSSWANGDPALVLKYDKDGKPSGAMYPDDPSNVHHSYLGDHVRFRNLHAGPKETHVFHLHAHQWANNSKDPNASYLDSQTISPGATFSYDIEFGGTGNRNYTPGDSIFHCHLYPHFAQGMWELWRSHDAFNDGKVGYFDASKKISKNNDPQSMNLPDAEVANGTETPAIVPLPSAALAPMPSEKFRGYPFYIPGKPGHRPPQPVLDFDVSMPWEDKSIEPAKESVVDGGLPRHTVINAGPLKFIDPRNPNPAQDKALAEKFLSTGGQAAQVIAQKVARQDFGALTALAAEWDTLSIEPLPLSGTAGEQTAMKFHEGKLNGPGLVAVADPESPTSIWWKPAAYRTNWSKSAADQTAPTGDPLFFVNGRGRAQGSPYANPCPESAPQRDYRAAFIQTELTYNKHGWFDPQGRIAILENDIKDIIDPDRRTRLPAPLFFRANSGECINFKSSNFVPSALNVDDFQIFTPTDTIGQHIHLVKFDVTSSDGSGNGWNYEDATFSPQEVRERVFAYNRQLKLTPGLGEPLKLKAHPLFAPGGDIFEAAKSNPDLYGELLKKGECPDQGTKEEHAYEELLLKEHPYCGAQRTTQRWWADPILNTINGKDNTLRTVFTHDHMGPSSHQQHGLYAGLVIEPANSVWTRVGSLVSKEDLIQAGKGELNCDLPRTDPTRRELCDRLIGGSNLASKTDMTLLKDWPGKPLLGVIEPRPSLTIRNDGGPTSTMANIIAPTCVGDSDSNPLQSEFWRNNTAPDLAQSCPQKDLTLDSRREFALAIADFGIAYNTALEAINPEPFGDNGFRDKSAIRFGRRHVPQTLARPLAISSEDPGGQYFNYRNEPIALRIADETPVDETPDKKDDVLGGFSYSQSTKRALGEPCNQASQDCLGDTANAFSTSVHAHRDEMLATTSMVNHPSIAYTQLFTEQSATEALAKKRLDDVLSKTEQWRRNFNCALYPKELLRESQGCNKDIMREEPWRVFGDPATPILPTFEGDRVQIRLVQGAQEAQHIFTMNGVKWHRLPGFVNPNTDVKGGTPGAIVNNSGFVNAQPVGISEHFEFDVTADPLKRMVTDRLYFGSSMDQLWDGLWGIMRTYEFREASNLDDQLTTSSDAKLVIRPQTFLAQLPDATPVELAGNNDAPCTRGGGAEEDGVTHRYYAIAAVKVCDLYGDCADGNGASKKNTGLTYSKRFDIHDQDAMAYVLERPAENCSEKTCNDRRRETQRLRSKQQVLEALRLQFGAGRKLEPLVLRAAAGQCLHVNLRNLLKPNDFKTASKESLPESKAYFNFLPMITDGFNVNQFESSSSVGISPAKISQLPVYSDGSNVGLNDAMLQKGQDFSANQTWFEAASDDGNWIDIKHQGSLVPPCIEDESLDRCQSEFQWSATDFIRTARGFNQPAEFGAIPLREFADPLKHPGHGLIGALIVGPEGSQVCANNRFAEALTVNGKAMVYNEGNSAEICYKKNYRDEHYVDHVLHMQDAIFASRGGMPLPDLAGAEEPDDYGVKGINYKTEPLWARTGNEVTVDFPDRNETDQADMMSSESKIVNNEEVCAAGIPVNEELKNHCDPETPVLEAKAGETVRLHFVHSGGHTRQQGLAVSGHSWNPYPWAENSRVFDSSKGSSINQGIYNGFGPMMGITLEFKAGGLGEVPLDYLIRSQASFLFDGGLWGILRVQK